MPSMTALLGLLAIAGYQNRDKLAELLKGAGASNPEPGGSGQPPGGLLKRIPVILKHSLRERNSWRIRLGLVVG
jgi:uncharacterized protein YidB (DUF937 family)